jgi:hypothetical protein
VSRAASVSTLTALEIFSSFVRCCPPNISSVTRDHDDCANSLAGGGLPTHFAGHALRPTTSPHRHSRIEASPCRRWRQCATAELVVVDLIAQQDPQSDAQLARHRDARLAEAFLLQLPPIESAQRGVAPDRMHRGFAPQAPQQRVPLLGEVAESLPAATRVLAWNQPDVTGQRLGIDEAGGVAEEYFGRERGDRTHAGVCHQSARLGALRGLRTDLLIELVDVRGEMVEERLQNRAASRRSCFCRRVSIARIFAG